MISYSCNKRLTFQLAGVTGNSLGIWCSFLHASLKTFLVILLCFFNHLPSWYVEWRTSAASSGCCRLPPSSSTAVCDSMRAHWVPTADLWYHTGLGKEVSHRPVLTLPPASLWMSALQTLICKFEMGFNFLLQQNRPQTGLSKSFFSLCLQDVLSPVI